MGASDAKRYYAGFTLERIGAFEWDVTDDGDGRSYTVNVDAGQFYLGRFARESHNGWQDKLETELNDAQTAAGGPGDWDVRWENDNLRWRVVRNSGATFEVAPNSNARVIMGGPILGDIDTDEFLSDFVPYYVLPTRTGTMSRREGPRSPRDVQHVTSRVTDAGVPYGVGATTAPKVDRWAQMFEEHRWVHRHMADPSAPTNPNLWTWEHLFEHVGTWEPIIIHDTDNVQEPTYSSNNVILRFKLRDALFMPERSFGQQHSHWNIPISAWVLEVNEG
ncbi:MAG: hypothetical protein ACOCR0_02440 [Haloferacaceae archaeon]